MNHQPTTAPTPSPTLERLHVWGPLALFTQPAFAAEYATYDAMTPTAAEGILRAIHWKPQMRWIVERIHVLAPIRHLEFKRNEVSAVASPTSLRRAMNASDPRRAAIPIRQRRAQRHATMLRDVSYLIVARIELTPRADSPSDNVPKHRRTFRRRAARGQCFSQPYLGTRECSAFFRLVDTPADLPPDQLPDDQRNIDLGWMARSIDRTTGAMPATFQARLRDGVLHVPPPHRP